MENKRLCRYWLLALTGVIIASWYPLSMGVRVIAELVRNGAVPKENYPKYIIPYTPISLALILGVLLLPVFLKRLKRYALLGASALSVAAFFGLEFLLEKHVVVTTAETVTKLEDWQMYMCYQPPGGWGTTVTEYKTHTAVEILMGEYNPAFKLHFYLISVVLILAILNCIFGFAQMISSGDRRKKRALILQAVSAALFLGLCILACFTAFWRDGSIAVSPLSAALMSVFFILLGITAGAFLGSVLLKRGRAAAIWVPTLVSAAITLLMYFGEMILLHGHLYRFGSGFFFEGIPAIVLAPADILVILASGLIAFFLMRMVVGGRPDGE